MWDNWGDVVKGHKLATMIIKLWRSNAAHGDYSQNSVLYISTIAEKLNLKRFHHKKETILM